MFFCTPSEGGPPIVNPPPDADLRSSVIDVVTGEEILDLGERILGRSAFNPEGKFAAGRYLAVTVAPTSSWSRSTTCRLASSS